MMKKKKYSVQVYHGEAGSIYYLIETKPNGDFDIVDTFPSRARLYEVIQPEEIEEVLAA